MLLAEPPPTQADLHFRLFGVPVRVHPLFWIVAIILGIGGMGPAAKNEADPIETVLWVVVVFVSILVHELGHAFLQRRFGGRPWITLHGFGGLASCDDCDRSPRSQILISLAGPAAGFVLAVVVVLVVRVAGHQIGLMRQSDGINWDALGIESSKRQPLLFMSVYFEPFASRPMNVVVADLLQVNILWGFINLLPIYPLDGGRIARELCTLDNPRRGIVQSLWLSIAMAAMTAGVGLVYGRLFIVLLFGYLAYASYQTLQEYQRY
jgi:Zn-dependent protease